MIWEKDGFTLRPALREDAEGYYTHNFSPLNSEVARLTGSKTDFSREEVVDFFLQCRESGDRFDFLLTDPQGNIVGESVLNEIDWQTRCANFRIALFHPELFGKGLGAWMTEKTLAFAFEGAKLHRVCLSVFSFNPRAIRCYEKAGFHLESIEDGEELLMAIQEKEWKAAQARLTL